MAWVLFRENYSSYAVGDDARNTMGGAIGNVSEVLYAIASDDRVLARRRDDTINEGAGADILVGGVADDLLFGETQADQFV